ncbi:hypothetical protein [Streptomyces jeddahensis]|uniref:Uncharacterized protein n=1 Tax=Streptomyces jeddahensis TaxID=1716141 RepID=A0A177HT19_9ACTN|nr:hypothetical protein [Streptomyces jeddahensis]OAH14152.1 hypothetical protein STSP_26020 [Streptomyces jeddahensis]
MPTAASLPPPDFAIASAFPEAAWLEQAAAANDWAAVRQYVDGLPHGTNRSFAFGVLADVPDVEHPLRQFVAAVPTDVFALTLLGTREVRMGWDIRTSARAEHVSREQFAQFHAYLRRAEQLLIRATALDPSHDAAWAERLNTARGLQLGQNEARRRYDRLAAYHPSHFSGQSRLLQQLCQESRRDGFAVVTAFADALPAKQDAVLGGFVDVLAGLQAGRIEQADLEAVRTRADAALTAPDGAVRRLPGAAEDLLAHRPLRGTDELRSELWATTPGHLHAVALEAAGTALMQVPAGHTADWAGYAAAPTSSAHTVAGKQFPSVRKDGSALIVGDEGVSLTTGKQTITVLYRACAAHLSWPDGARQLIGSDGLAVQVEPGLYGIDAHTMATIDAAVDPAATVWLPPRQKQPRADEGAAAAAGEAGPARSAQPAPVRRTGPRRQGWSSSA